MKKLLIFAVAALLAAPAGLSAQKAFYVKDGKKTQVDAIEVKGENYLMKMGAATRPVKMDDVSYVWTPKPAEVAAADEKAAAGSFEDAAAAYAAAAKQYQKLGWEVYCLTQQAEALKKAGKTQDAIKLLESLQMKRSNSPEDQTMLANASIALGQIYLAAKQYDKAMSFVVAKTSSSDDNAASSAYLLRGDIYAQKAAEMTGQDQKKELKNAAMAYFAAALLFENTGNRPLALFRSYETLKKLNDARAEEFARILREKYPNNAYTKQLK